MKMESDFHMAKGDGETSYTNNSMLQRKAMIEAKPVLQKAVKEACTTLLPRTMVIADLGCSSGPNTLMFISEVIGVAAEHCREQGHRPMELQFFLNDLPSNDFNHLFNSLKQLDKVVVAVDLNHSSEALALPPYYIAGLPGSYYTRLFPNSSVHLFHSSFCLHWRSQMFKEIEGKDKEYKNEGNIYIASTTPLSVVRMFQEQFQKDLTLFLELRAKELVVGGQLVLTFLGRETEDVYNGDMNHMAGLLSQSLQSLVNKGLVEKTKLDSFNLPIYEPYIDEVKAVVEQSELFNIVHIEMFESDWDPQGDSSEGSGGVQDSIGSGRNVAKYIRAVMGPLFASHFGESVLDELFEEFAGNVTAHIEQEEKKARVEREDKCPVIILSLRSRSLSR